MKKTTATTTTANTLKKKQVLLEVLERVFRELEDIEQWAKETYKCTGYEEIQATDRDGNLLWEDEEETKPKYKAIYGYVPKDEEEFTEEDILKLEAVKTVKTLLETII